MGIAIKAFTYIFGRIGGDLYMHLRRQGKKHGKRRNGKSTRGQIKNRVSIDDSPEIVDYKSRIGDGEIDTSIGKKHSGALVTIVALVTKYTVSAQVNRKSAADVTKVTVSLLNPVKDIVHTITADKEKGFSCHEKISQALSVEVYFAHPYISWERGLNENTKGLLRQYFPKNTDFKKVGQIKVKLSLMRLNSQPRKDLNFKTPALIMGERRAALAA